MEDNLRMDIPLPSPDHEAEAEEDCGSESTGTDSVMSGITVDSSAGFLTRNVDAGMDQSTGWTDEKHNSYLNRLEESFVQHLHRSIQLRDRKSRRNLCGLFSSDELLSNNHDSADQFTVLQDCCWQKVNFGGNEPLLDRRANSHVVLGSSWIHHLAPVSQDHTATRPAPQESEVGSEEIQWRRNLTCRCASERNFSQKPDYRAFHDKSVGSTAEVSDQNFVNEDEGEELNRMSRAIRVKRAAADVSSNDQVVPFKFRRISVPNVGHTFPEGDEQELLPEQPENFACQKADLHYFLRAS